MIQQAQAALTLARDGNVAAQTTLADEVASLTAQASATTTDQARQFLRALQGLPDLDPTVTARLPALVAAIQARPVGERAADAARQALRATWHSPGAVAAREAAAEVERLAAEAEAEAKLEAEVQAALLVIQQRADEEAARVAALAAAEVAADLADPLRPIRRARMAVLAAEHAAREEELRPQRHRDLAARLIRLAQESEVDEDILILHVDAAAQLELAGEPTDLLAAKRVLEDALLLVEEGNVALWNAIQNRIDALP